MNTKKRIGPLKEAIEKVTETKQRLDYKLEEVRQEVNQNCKRCREVIQEREEEILTQVNNLYRMKSKTLEIQLEELQLMLGNLNSSIDFTESLLRHGNEAEVMIVKKQMTQRLHELNNLKLEYLPLEDALIDYTFSTDNFRKAIEHIGEVKVYHAYPPYCFATGVGIHRAKAGLEAVFLVTAKDRMNEIYSGKGEPISVEIEPPEGDPVPSRYFSWSIRWIYESEQRRFKSIINLFNLCDIIQFLKTIKLWLLKHWEVGFHLQTLNSLA